MSEARRRSKSSMVARKRTRRAGLRTKPSLLSLGTNVPMHRGFTRSRVRALKATVFCEVPAPGAKEQEWLRYHWREHIGRWVALQEGQLVGEAISAREALEQARSSGHSSPFLVHVTEPSELPFGGW